LLKLGVLVSGTGTNLQAILDAVSESRLHAEVSVVISNKPGVLALERAERARVPTICLPHKEYASREEFDAALVHALREAGVELVVLAGFMRLLTPTFLDAFPMRVVNIHPALLPAFPGVDAQRQAVEYGVKITGCTVHFVDEGTDTGPIVAQRAIAVEEADVDSLRQRLLKVEHELLVDALELIAKGRVTVVPGRDGERTRVTVRSE
jgi:phosphoribosylglycinamide formyltransferase-1